MSKSLLFAIAGIAALLSAALFVYSFWLQIIQTHGDVALRWSGIMAFVALCSLVLAMIWRR